MNYRRIIILVLFCLLLHSQLLAQQYYTVITVDGKIERLPKGQLLSTGDQIDRQVDLRFYTNTSRAAVINPYLGRFILKPPKSAPLQAGRAEFVPPISSMRTRSQPFLTNYFELKDFFSQRFLLIDSFCTPISAQAFPMNDKQFFFLRYNYKGDTINKKLPNNKHWLVFNKEDIFTIDNQMVEVPDSQTVHLFYLDENQVSSIGSFQLNMPPTEKIEKEVAILIHVLANEEKEKMLNEVTGFIRDFYGYSSPEQVEQFVQTSLPGTPAE